MIRRLLLSGIVPILACLTGAPGMAGERTGWRHSLSAASVHVPGSHLDGGGRTGLNSYHLRAGAERELQPSMELGVRMSYDAQRRRFSGTSGLGASRPWSDTRQLAISSQLARRSRHGWSYGFRPFVAWSSESGDLDSDALSYGTGLAVAGGFSPRHRVGIGARVSRDIDRSLTVHPIVLIDWEFNSSWTLRNPRDSSFTTPAGLELVYHKTDDWRFALAAIYHSSEFRLDESRAAPGGIGESRGILSFLRVTRHWAPGLNLNAYLGCILDGELRLRDSADKRIAAAGYDPAPLLGVSMEGSF